MRSSVCAVCDDKAVKRNFAHKISVHKSDKVIKINT